MFAGTGFSCTVNVAGTQVGGTQFSNGNGGTGNGTTVSGSSLVRTGIDVAVMLAVALVLVLAGWQLVRAAKRRRRRIAAQERPRHLVR